MEHKNIYKIIIADDHKIVRSGIKFTVESQENFHIEDEEIAEKLVLSQKNISTYRTRILEKLSLSNTNQLVHFTLQNSLGQE